MSSGFPHYSRIGSGFNIKFHSRHLVYFNWKMPRVIGAKTVFAVLVIIADHNNTTRQINQNSICPTHLEHHTIPDN